MIYIYIFQRCKGQCWPSIKPALDQGVVFAGNVHVVDNDERIDLWGWAILWAITVIISAAQLLADSTALQSDKAVSAYLQSKQILPFGFAWQQHSGANITIFWRLPGGLYYD